METTEIERMTANIAVEKLFSECLRLQCDADLLVDGLQMNKAALTVEELEKGFNEAIEILQRNVEIMNNIFAIDSEQTKSEEYRNYFSIAVNRKNQLIQQQARILAEKFNIAECKTIMTLSDTVLYRWRESEENKDEGLEMNNIDKEIVGNGSIQLIKAVDRLHYLVVSLEEPAGETVEFYLTPRTPVLVSERGHYVIQVGNSDFYGIIFPPNMPVIYTDVFEKQVSAVCQFIHLKPGLDDQTKKQEEIVSSTSIFSVVSLQSLSQKVEDGSSSVTNMILSTSAMISVGIRGGGLYLQSNMERHTEPVKVSPFIQKSIAGIRSVTPYAVTGSSFMINSLSGIVEGVGCTIINGIKYVLPEGDKNENGEKNEALEAATQFGKSSIKALGSILSALSDGVNQIYEGASETTVDIVNHKYGQHAAEITHQSFSIGKDVVDTAMTLGTAKQVAVKVMKNGGTKIVQNTFNNNNNNNNNTNKNLLEDKKEEEEESTPGHTN